MSGEWWSFVTIGGGIAFVIVVLWALLNNRQTRAQRETTEAATRDLRNEMEAERRETGQP